MNQLDHPEKTIEERDSLWITIDIKSLPSATVRALASYTNDANVLDILADFPDLSNKLQVANNPHTLGKTLKRLAHEQLSFIKEAVAKHNNTFEETLEDLSKDEDEIVRIAAASNFKTPAKALILRLFDPCRNVVIAAIRNPMTPSENIKMLLDIKDPIIAYEVRHRLKKDKIEKDN